MLDLRNAIALLLLASPAAAQSVRLVDATPSGGTPAAGAINPALSNGGAFVTFFSDSTDLVPGISSGRGNVYLRDMGTSRIELVSVAAGGGEPNGDSADSCISPDARFVAFSSRATDVTADVDVGDAFDVFLLDRQSGATALVTVATGGGVPDGDSRRPSLSDDGQLVAFQSLASDLVAGDTNGLEDVFVRDRVAGTTTLVSAGMGGALADGRSHGARLSADGRYVAFTSAATNLVGGDANGRDDVFVRDLQAGTTVRASVSMTGGDGDGFSSAPSISGSGRYVLFQSSSTNLTADPVAIWSHVFLRDTTLGTTTLVSKSSAGAIANSSSFVPSLSDDGSAATFTTFASNLTTPPTPGVAHGVVRVDLSTGSMTPVAVSPCGLPLGASSGAAIAPDGAVVGFVTSAAHVVPEDVNGELDVFLFDPVGVPRGAVCSYCNVAATTNGCLPTMAASGAPSASAGSGFDISVGSVEGQRAAVFVHGLGSKSVPWGASGPSTLCVQVGGRLGQQTSGGTASQCDGGLLVDWNANVPVWAQPGDSVFVQAWFRDPPSVKTTHLSNALSFTLLP